MRFRLIALLLFPILSFAQFSPRFGGNIPNATTDFGVNFSKGITVYDTTSHKYYVSIMAVSSTDDLTSAAFKFIDITAGANLWNINGSHIYYNSGNIGIGTSAPLTKLHVYNSDYGDIFLTNSTLGSRYGAGLRGYGVGGEGGRTELGVLDDGTFTKGISISSQGSLLQFFTGTSAGSLTERMRITPTGRVGIGTTAVNTELEVNGVIKATGGTSTDWNNYRTSFTNSNKDTVPVVLFVGNSLTTGWNCTTDTPPSTYVSVPTHNGVAYSKINIGVGGMKALWLDSARGTTVIDNYHNRAGKNIMVLWIGINDLLTGRTPGQVFSSLEAFSTKYKALGWKIIVCTPPSCQPQTRNIDQRRYTYDSLIRFSYSNFSDGLADLAIEPHIGPLGSYSNTTYFCDQIHLTTLGSQMAANVIQAALVELITNERNKSLNNIISDTIFPNQVTVRANGYNVYHPQLRIQGVDDLHKKLAIGYNTSSDYGFIQAYQETVGYNSLLLNQDGGNIGIGTAVTGNDKLRIAGTSTANTGTPILNVTTGTGATTDEQLQFGVHDGDYSWLQAVKPGTGYRDIILNGLGGNIGIGTTAPTAKLEVSGLTKTTTLQVGAYNVSVTGNVSIPQSGSMVYPGAGIPVSTGSAWGTSITDASANWNTAYSHVSNTSNPHSVTKTQVGLGNVANTAQVTSVTGTAPIVSSGGTTPAISMPQVTGSVDGYMTAGLYNMLIGKLTDPTTTAGDIVYRTAGFPVINRLGIGESGNLLTVIDGLPSWRAIPILNQNTTGTAAGLTSQYIDWNSGSGGNSIANKPTLQTIINGTGFVKASGTSLSYDNSTYLTSNGLPNVTNKAQVELEDSTAGPNGYTSWYDGTTGLAAKAPLASPTFTGTATIPNTLNTAIPGTDHTTSGTLISLTATANSAIGDVIYIASTGKGTFCKADAVANCPYALAICADATINADAAGNWLVRGQIRDDTWNWTVGGLIYISTTGTTGNTLTQTAPSGANNVIMAVGVALSADVMYFFGNLIPIEHN